MFKNGVDFSTRRRNTFFLYVVYVGNVVIYDVIETRVQNNDFNHKFIYLESST